MRRSGARAAAATLAWLGVITALAGPGASAAWQPPALLPGSQTAQVVAHQQSLRIDGRGAALATWLERFEGERSITRTATRPPGGAWAAGPALHDEIRPETLSLYGQTRAVLLALRPTGPAFPQDVDVRVRFGRSDGSFGRSRRLAGGPAADAAVAANRSGRVAAAWATGRAGSTVVKAVIRPAGASFGSVTTLSRSFARNPAVAISAGGDVVVAWWRKTGRGRRIEARIRRVGEARWQPVADLAPLPRGAPQTVAAADPLGRFVVAWQDHDIGSGGDDQGVVAGFAVRPISGRWRHTTLADSPSGGRFEHGRIDAEYLTANQALVAWTAPGDGRHRVRVSYVIGTSVRTVNELDGPRQLSGGAPDLAVGPGRRAIVAWLEGSEEIEPLPPVPSRVLVSERRPGAGFGTSQALSSQALAAAPPLAAFGPRGEALVGWRAQVAARVHAMFASAGP